MEKKKGFLTLAALSSIPVLYYGSGSVIFNKLFKTNREYEDKDTLDISDDFLKELKKELQFFIENFGPINTQELKGYHLLPSIDLEWNKYLLVGLIKTFLSENFKIDYTDRYYNKTDFIIDLV